MRKNEDLILGNHSNPRGKKGIASFYNIVTAEKSWSQMSCTFQQP